MTIFNKKTKKKIEEPVSPILKAGDIFFVFIATTSSTVIKSLNGLDK